MINYPLHILNLTNSLSLFQSCTVHIISNQIYQKDAENYLLDAPGFPIVYSLHQYYLDLAYGFFHCNQNINYEKKLYTLNRTKAEFRFRSTPNPRLTCSVTIIIDPLPCFKWEFVRYVPKGAALATPLDTRIITSTFMDPVYDIQPRVALHFTTNFKHNWIWIHVEQHSIVSSFTALDSSHIFFVLEHKSPWSKYLPIIPPVKILFRVEATTIVVSQTTYTVTQAYFASHRNALKPVFSLIEIICKFRDYNHVKNHLYPWKRCIQNVLWELVYLTLTPVDLNKHSNLVSLLLFSDEPAHNLVAFVAEPDTSSSAGIYWMAQQSHETITNSVISELFANSTTYYNSGLLFEDFLISYVFIKSSNSASGAFSHDEPFPLHFLSCTGLKISDELSIKDFVSAFHWQTWLSLISMSVISGLFLNRIKRKNTKDLFADVTFVYNLILCQSCSAIKAWKWNFAPWLFAAIIFSYSYQGKNINRLCRSLQNKPIDSFDEILARNFSIYSPGIPENLERIKSMGKERRFSHFIFTKWLLPRYAKRMLATQLDLYTNFHNKPGNLNLGPDQFKESVNRLLVRPKTLEEIVQMSEPAFLASQLKKCKSHALVDTYEKITTMFTILNKLDGIKTDNLHINTNPLNSEMREWSFLIFLLAFGIFLYALLF